MKDDIKALIINIIAGVLSFYVTKYLDSNNLPILSYFVFAMYILFISLASYFHIKKPASKTISIAEDNFKKCPEENKENNKPEIFHRILELTVKLSSQRIDATPKIIGKEINESPEIVLAYLKQMGSESLVSYTSGGKPPDINTSFFIAYHENPWKFLKIKSS